MEMKKITAIIAAAAATVTLATSASAMGFDIHKAPEAVEQTFNKMFSGAYDIEWEKERGLYVADFILKGTDKEAWFKGDGSWVKTMTDIAPSELPAAVTDKITAEYPGWHIDDADFFQTVETGDYYRIEIEKRDGIERKLRVKADGTIF